MIKNNIIYTKFKENRMEYQWKIIFLELTRNQKIKKKKMPSEVLSKLELRSKKMRFFCWKKMFNC